MRVFLDTNVILDFYDAERGHYLPAAIIFDLALKGQIHLVVCAQSFVNAFYILRKSYDRNVLYARMHNLLRLCEVSPVDVAIIEEALNYEGRDFEDAVQYYSSVVAKSDVLLTRDKTGFKGFEIKVQSPSEFLDEFIPLHP